MTASFSYSCEDMWHIPLHWWARMSSARSKLDVEEPYTLKRRIISAT